MNDKPKDLKAWLVDFDERFGVEHTSGYFNGLALEIKSFITELAKDLTEQMVLKEDETSDLRSRDSAIKDQIAIRNKLLGE